jgi:hypothetical protein
MRRIVLAVLAIAVACGAIAYFVYQPHKTSSAQVLVQQIPQIDYSTVAMTKPYSNDTYKFSLMMPADFTATEGTSDASTTILLQNRSGDGVQILILPWDEPAGAFTAERITKSTGLSVTDTQPIKIKGATGLTFKSDNPAFDGATSEGWFTYGGNLYEISTYDRLDPLLKKIFATWKFF